MTPDVSHFFQNLKTFRQQKDLTQQELAIHLRIGKGNIARYERGEVIPKLDVVLKMTELLEVSLDVLCGKMTEEASKLEKLAKIAAKLPEEKQQTICKVMQAFLKQ